MNSFLIAVLAVCLYLLHGIAYPAAQTFGPYAAEVVRVVDGDTVEIQAGVWPGMTANTLLRLEGIDAAEMRSKAECERFAATLATEHLKGLVAAAKQVRVTDVRPDKYGGRSLGKLMLDGLSASDLMLNTGHAIAYVGEGRAPWACAP